MILIKDLTFVMQERNLLYWLFPGNERSEAPQDNDQHAYNGADGSYFISWTF